MAGLSERHLKLIENRGLDAEIVSRLGIETCEEAGDLIRIPYLVGSETVNRKFRSLDGDKHFHQDKDGRVCFYNFNVITDSSLKDEPLLITEGECLTEAAEILTPNGWLSIADYRFGPVAQWCPKGIDWVVPSARLKRLYEGELIRFANSWMQITVTPGHRMPGLGIKRDLVFVTASARETGHLRHHLLPRSGVLAGPGINLSNDELALCIAVSADGTVGIRKCGSRYSRMTFLKTRKIRRMEGLLARLGLKHCRTDNTRMSGGKSGRFFGVPLPEWVPGRMLPWLWIAEATAAQREFLIAELKEWDGNSVKGKNQDEFSSKYMRLADWVQTLAHTSGRCSTIIPRTNQYGKWFKVSILHGKQHGSYQTMKGRRIKYNGFVYCLTVPSGMFLVREKGAVFVTGNCDTWAAIQAGFPRSISVPNGAPSQELGESGDAKYGYVRDAAAAMGDIREIILCTDGDPPGVNLLNDLAIRLGKARCKWITYPKECKDLNDALRLYGVRGVQETIKRARWVRVDGVYRMSELPPVPYQPALDAGIPLLGKHYKLRLGDFVVIVGIPGHGKTVLANDVCCHMAENHGWDTAFASFEQRPQVDHKRLLRTWYHKKRPVFQTPEEKREADQWIDRHFSFICPSDDDDPTVAWVLSKAAAAVLRHGVRILVIDPYNELDHIRPDGVTLTEYVGISIKEFRRFGKKYNVHVIVVVHPTKLQREKNGKMPMPTLYDASDSAHWGNKSDVGIIVYRPDDSSTIIKVAKSRYHDDIGVPGQIEASYLIEQGRFMIHEDV